MASTAPARSAEALHPTDDFTRAREVYAWFVVFALCVTGIVSYIDRQIINLLVDEIRADLGINDTQMSLLQGIAFAMFYAIMAVPLARLADSSNRKWVIIFGIICWSMATFASGLAVGFAMLFVARMFVGVGEATLTPAGYSMLSDYFPREKLSGAISMFTGSSFVGSGVALLVGGALIGWLHELGPQDLGIFGIVKPWQMTFLVMSVPSIMLIGLMLLVREPPRKQAPGMAATASQSVPMREVMGFLRDNARAIMGLYIGFSILAAGNFGINAWVPTFLSRTYGWSPQQIGNAFGPMVIIISASGVLVGGWLCNAMIRRGWADANMRMPIGAALIALVFATAFPQMPTGELALLCLAPALFFGSMPFGAGTAALPLISPNRMRAQIVAFYLLIANLFGFSLGPTSIALVTDYVFGDPAALRHSLSIVLPILILAGVAVLIWGLGAYRGLVERQAEAAASA